MTDDIISLFLLSQVSSLHIILGIYDLNYRLSK